MSAPQPKQKPSGIWFIEFTGESGERRRVSTGIKTAPQKQAPPEVRAKMRDIVLGLDQPIQPGQSSRNRGGQVTMKDLFDRCEKTVWHPDEAKSQATITSNIKILTPMIGDIAIQDMTYTRLEKLVADLKERGYAPATIKRKLDMVSKALRMATKWTDEKGRPLLAAKPPMPTIRVANMKDRILETHEEIAVFNAIDARLQSEPGRQWLRFRALVRFLLDTGARLAEAIGTGPDAISTIGEHHVVTFARYRTKNDKPRTVPLTQAAWEALELMRPSVAKIKGGWSFFPMTHGTAWYMWDTIREDLKKAGLNIDDVTLHTLRHTCLTRLARGGMDILRVKEWAGHSDIKITVERYTHLKPGDLLGGLAILGSSNPTSVPNQEADNNNPASVIITDDGVNRAKTGTPLYN